MKLCRVCGPIKGLLPLSKFYKCKTARDGHRGTCKDCVDGKMKALRQVRKKAGLPSYSVVHDRKKRLEVLRHYGGDPPKCACCGEATNEFLVLDHEGGGGSQHRRKIGLGQVYRWVRRHGFPAGFRVLCHNCNASLGHYGYCPHQGGRSAP